MVPLPILRVLQTLSHFHPHDTLVKPAFFIALLQREKLRCKEVTCIAQSEIPDIQPGLMLPKENIYNVFVYGFHAKCGKCP